MSNKAVIIMTSLCKSFPFFFFLFSFFFLLTCSKDSTKPETVTFSGSVTLEGETDHSGVTVSLYNLVQLDTALVRINQQYPNIGVQISQETEFDHREHSPVHNTTTDANGNWQIDGVTPGSYNVVAEKDSFGWRYYLDMNDSRYSSTINLTRAHYLKNNLTQNLVLNDEFVYLENLIIPENIILEINGMSEVQIRDNSTIEVSGQLKIEGTLTNSIYITSDFGKIFNDIRVDYNGHIEIRNTVISGSKNGIYNRSSNIILYNVYFKNNGIAFQNFDVRDTLFINNCLFKSNFKGIENFGVLGIRIMNNIFYLNSTSIRIESGQTPSSSSSAHIEQNIFLQDDRSIRLNEPAATYNELSSGEITNNSFKDGNVFFQIGKNVNYTVNFNNILNAFEYFVLLRGATGVDTLNFEKNYWGIFIQAEIKDQILDVEDISSLETYVDVKNFLYVPVEM